ncbi:MAG: DUF58 domain-containing protein [Thermodesulfobacteriota bacterium]
MSESLLDIETALRLKRFNFRTSSKVSGYKSGIHKSTYTGISPDFSEHKQYNRGDELKQIDWRLYGRHDRLYVKKYEDEVNMRWCILIDKSASMDYGHGSDNKFGYAKKLAATLSYLLLKQGDAVGLIAFSETGVEQIPPKSGSHFITPILDKLSNLTSSGKTVLEDPVLDALETYRSDASFVIISDFLIETELIEKSITLCRNSSKELSLFHVLHPDETDFDFKGSIEFEDLETSTKVIVDADSLRHTYIKRIGEFIAKLKDICHENESRYVLSPTNQSIERSLIQIADK